MRGAAQTPNHSQGFVCTLVKIAQTGGPFRNVKRQAWFVGLRHKPAAGDIFDGLAIGQMNDMVMNTPPVGC